MTTNKLSLLWLDLNASFAHSSLALPAIHAQTLHTNLSQSIEWDLLQATLHMPVSTIVNMIVDKQPDIIAATAWLFTTEMLRAVLIRVKALLPACKIVLGGPEFLGSNELYLRHNPYVYGVFRGEGEESFPLWLSKLLDEKSQIMSKASLADVSGACYIDDNNIYRDNGISKVSRFADLVAPEESQFFCTEKAFVQLETTRGCFNTCAFCTSGNDKPVRRISFEEIEKRLAFYADKGISHIRLLDRTFNANSQLALDMLDLFESYEGKLCFHLEIHPALLGEKLKARLATLPAGILHLEAGIQSLRQNVLTLSKRLGSLEDSLKGLSYLCSLENMEVHADLIAGLPGYKLDELFEDVISLAQLKAGEIQLELLKILPGTEMHVRAKELNLIYSELPPYEILASDGMTPSDLQKAKKLSRMIDMYYNAPAWQFFMQQILISDVKFIYEFLDWLDKKNMLDNPLSLEKRGLLLFDFVNEYAPLWNPLIAYCWIKAGLPIKKIPYRVFYSLGTDQEKKLYEMSGCSAEKTKLYAFKDPVIPTSCYVLIVNTDANRNSLLWEIKIEC